MTNDVVYIGASLPTKADQLTNVFSDYGIKIRPVGGHGRFIHPDSANTIFESFVEDLKGQTKENIPQGTLDDVYPGEDDTGNDQDSEEDDECPPGFRFFLVTCIDINECQVTIDRSVYSL